MNCSSRLSQNMICEIRADCCNQILTRINTDTIHLDILALNSEIPSHQIKKKTLMMYMILDGKYIGDAFQIKVSKLLVSYIYSVTCISDTLTLFIAVHFSLRWRQNGRDSVSNHQPGHCLLSLLFGRRSKKTSKLRVTGLCVGNSPGPVNSPHKGPVTRKMFPFDDVIMFSSLSIVRLICYCDYLALWYSP